MPKSLRQSGDPQQAEPLPDPLNMERRREAWGLSQRGAHAEAAEIWRAILVTRYDDADAADELGLTLTKLGRFDEAVAAFERALQFDHRSLASKMHLGQSLLTLGRYADARYSFEDILGRRPEDHDALIGLAAAFRGLGSNEAALHAAERAQVLRPRDVEGLVAKARALQALARPNEAMPLFREALKLRADHREAAASLAKLLSEGELFRETADVLRAYLGVDPNDVGVLIDLGAALLELREYAEAVVHYRRAIALQPTSAIALCNISLALSQLNRFEEAITACKSALAIEPASSTAQFNLSDIYLALGRFDKGWQAYEFRFASRHKGVREDIHAAPWCGEDLHGKSILVLGEQANGDYLQFCRYLQTLVDLGATVSLFAPKRLIRLLSTLPVEVRFLSELVSGTRFDFQIWMMSVPGRIHRLGRPVPAPPYLRAEPDRVARWRDRIGQTGFRVGITWQGQQYAGRQSQRAFRLDHLWPLSQIEGLRLISLQIGDGVEQLSTLPPGLNVEVLGADFDSGEDAFLDAAAVIANLDLVVTCDTSLAHLAGALGGPVWIALLEVPEWRWQRHGSDTPWYPNARLFRQSARGDWDGVFHSMAATLREPGYGIGWSAPEPTAEDVSSPLEAFVAPPLLWSKGVGSLCDFAGPRGYQDAATESTQPEELLLDSFGNARGVVWLRLSTLSRKGLECDLDKFARSVLPTIQSPFSIVTTDGDASVPSDLRAETVTRLLDHPLLVSWHTQNCDGAHPKLKPFPIGLDLHSPRSGMSPGQVVETITKLSRSAPPAGERLRRVFCDVHLNANSQERRDLAAILGRCPHVDFLPERVAQEAIWTRYTQYPLVVSTHGRGLDAHRTWELLYLGCIVITMTSPLDPLFDGLPVVIVRRWDEVLDVENLERWVEHFAPMTARGYIHDRLRPDGYVNKVRQEIACAGHSQGVDTEHVTAGPHRRPRRGQMNEKRAMRV